MTKLCDCESTWTTDPSTQHCYHLITSSGSMSSNWCDIVAQWSGCSWGGGGGGWSSACGGSGWGGGGSCSWGGGCTSFKWDEASTNCAMLGGYLAIINSQTEYTFVFNTVNPTGESWVKL